MFPRSSLSSLPSVSLSLRPSVRPTPPSSVTAPVPTPAEPQPKETAPTSIDPPKPETAAKAPARSNAWSSHVKAVYADLKKADGSTTFKQALSHARASYQEKKVVEKK